VIRFTPRKPTSVWSRRNIEFVERLTAEGRMTDAGLAAFAFKDRHPDSGYATADFDDALRARWSPDSRRPGAPGSSSKRNRPATGGKLHAG
jgi:hypothetical protein